jgi:1-hydroxy-2-naphthoate dioxygenase
MSSTDALAGLDAKLAAAAMRGQWKSEAFLSAAIGGPKPAGAAHIWTWAQVMELMAEAERAMPESLQARRSLIFQNPGLPRGTTHTINMGVQMIMPGEVAWAHRHSIAALRFIIEGDPQLTTIVDGRYCVMETGDLVLTPNWAWHDHHNKSGKQALWLDVLDVPLVLGLNQTFYEPGSSEDQPQVDPHRRLGALRYPWREAMEGVSAAPLDPVLGQVHHYLDPDSGGPCLTTLACRLVRLPPGFNGAFSRHTASSVFFVVKGAGRVRFSAEGAAPLAFGARDSFAIPNWAGHAFSNASEDEEAVLFCVSDEPVIRALGLYRKGA